MPKVKKKKTSMRYKNYEAKGSELKRKNQFCPKCGPGIFMAAHKDRNTCGQCGYTEMKTKQK
jgi:ubiquitin-small subunit ribosomal protein S27Ae